MSSDWQRELEARAAAKATDAKKPVEEKDPLRHVGTRFDHYTELIDKYVEACKRIQMTFQRFPNNADYLKWQRCEAFVRIMRDEMEKLANIDNIGFEADRLTAQGRKAVTPEIKKAVREEGEALRKIYGTEWGEHGERPKPIAGESPDASPKDDGVFGA